MTPIACIYHKDCIDGTTAAAVVLERFPSARCFPVGHTHAAEELSDIFQEMDPDAHLYIVDTVHGIEPALACGQRVTVLDHHISEHDRVREYASAEERLEYVFDNTKSGASLAWSYFFEADPMPKLIAHVEDIDLWLQRLGEGTEHVANYLSILRNDPNSIRALFAEPIETVYERGSLLTANMHMEMKRLLELDSLPVSISGRIVPAFNITNHQSHCGNELASRRGEAVALYTIRGETVRFSFRSQDGHTPSALELAESIGGGGHRNAAGATMPIRDFITNLHL